MFNSIRLRLTLYFSLLIFVILFGTSYLLYQDAYKNQISHIDGSLHVIVNDLNKDIEEDGEEEISDDIEELEDEVQMGRVHVRILGYDLINKTKTTLLKSSTTDESYFAHFDLNKEINQDKIFYKTSKGYRTATQYFAKEKDNVKFIQVAVELSCKENTIGTLVSVNIIIFLFSTIGSYLLISRTLQSVNSVVRCVNQIKSYDYTKRISTQNIPNEIKELIHTFNKLLVRHQSSFDKISQFSSDASHELKTPLTSMRGEIEVGLRRERDKKEYQQILQKSLSKIIEIQKLIDGLLFLAKSDKLEIKSSFEEVYIDEIISECKDELYSLAQSKSIKIKMNLIPLTIKGDSRLLKIACINILKNAILYSPTDTEIKISIEKKNSKFTIIFQDQGVGVSKEDINHIFDRFYRAKKVKARVDGGMGLGLSIVKVILDIHEFDIIVESEVNRGTIVKIFMELSSN